MPDPINPTDPIIDDVNKSTESYIWNNDKMLVIFYIILVAGSVIGIIYTKLDIRLLYIPAIIGIIGYGHVKAKIKREFTQQFGASIGFAYSPSLDMSSVDGKLFKVGHSQKIYDVLSGTMNGRSSRIFSYQFTVGGGKNSHTYYCTVFETTFSNNMPDIVLTTKTETFLGGFPQSSFFDGTERVELEGDFNKYFTLKVPKGYETKAYQIFPPNVMADLIDKAKDLNFEFNGNNLYIYATNLILVREKLQVMFDLAEYLDNLFARSARAVDVATTNL
jgi:xanthosine utilization system XapX-like protein